MKLILFGDSHLAKFKTKYIKSIEENCVGLDVYNCAFGGATSDDGINKVSYISNLNPELVLLSFGTNDILKNSTSDKQFITNLNKIIKSFNTSRVIVLIIPNVNDPDDINGTRDLNKIINIYNDEIQNYCKDNNLEYLNILENVEIKTGEKDLYHDNDGIHLNDTGYKTFVDILSNKINHDNK